MAMTAKEKAAAKKAITQAQALIAKQKARVAELETFQTSIKANQVAAAKEAEAAKEALVVENKAFAASIGGTYNTTTGKIEMPEKPTISAETRDAFEGLKTLFTQYGLGSLSSTITAMMEKGLLPAEAATALKYDNSINPATGKPWNDAYRTRFAGNFARTAKGLNAYDEATYLDIENSYEETLRRYGLGNMISASREENQKKWAGYMANDIASTEFAERIKTVSDRVLTMDPRIKEQFNAYYPSLTNTDLVSYFLDPKETMPMLEAKVAAAEIGAAARQFGLQATQKGMAEELVKLGIDKGTAQAGYETISEFMPRTQFLSQVYDEQGINYNQTTAEEEQFKGLASAKRKRQQLISTEQATFAGSSGTLRTGKQQGNTGTF